MTLTYKRIQPGHYQSTNQAEPIAPYVIVRESRRGRHPGWYLGSLPTPFTTLKAAKAAAQEWEDTGLAPAE